MKVSFVSSQAISQALRYQTMSTQTQLTNAIKEMGSGRHADVGATLGARTGFSLSMSREVERITGQIDANMTASTRLSSTQLALTEMSGEADTLLSDLITARNGALSRESVQQAALSALDKTTTVLNTTFNGEYIFAGINTDVRPIAGFDDPSSPPREAFDDAFLAHFGFAVDDPLTAGISGADMSAFLTGTMQEQFLGSGWNDSWSSATDQQIVSRIALNETAPTSISANIDGARNLVMAAASVTRLFDAALSDEAANAVLDHAIGAIGASTNDIAQQQGNAGISEQRLSAANERMEMQKNLLTLNVGALEEVNAEEVSTRLTALKAQLEISYTLTATLQNLRLLKYL